MTRSIRRQLRFLHAYVVVTMVSFVVLSVSAFTRSGQSQNLGEITVERINVVDANGTLRMVLSNKDRMHPGVMDGKTINRPRPVAGLLFFNDAGDEVGGLTFTGQDVNGRGRADANLALDQWKQDQIIGIHYTEEQGQRTAGLQVWDRSETQRLSELIERMNSANAIADLTARKAAVQAAGAGADPGTRRLFVGKDRNRASVVTLADATGKARLEMKVGADGQASIEFLDAQGRVTQRVGPGK